jgi:DNA-binding transcriptional MerR regulator/2-polyprenyl-3-methyl-5-hydroxy-6-metoxy-1,4-benzoquinol methylase
MVTSYNRHRSKETTKEAGTLPGKQQGNPKWLTAGQFAERAGVTIRTVRFYDKVGLLRPSSRSESGYRLYSEQDFARLQRILTLRFIGLTLDEIKGVINRDEPGEDLRESLRIQHTIIRRKIEHLRLVHKAVGETLEALDAEAALALPEMEPGDAGPQLADKCPPPGNTAISSGSRNAWDRFISIIEVVNREEKWAEQYRDARNLHTRIRLHDRYSVNPRSWHRWLFDRLALPARSRILEVGCGDASLWKRNLDRIPEGWEIVLTDLSEGMAGDARENLGSAANRFTIQQADVCSLPFPDASFDAVLANHMLYHVDNRETAFREIRRVLRPGGKVIAATIGSRHLKQMKDLLVAFDPKLQLSDTNLAEEFGLDNGADQLRLWFDDIRRHLYEDALHITDATPFIDYVMSTSGNFRDILTGQQLAEFRRMTEEAIRKEGALRIEKETGLFEAVKPI